MPAPGPSSIPSGLSPRGFRAVLLLSALSVARAEDPLQPVAAALQGEWGRIKVDLRYRYEYVDQEGDLEEAHASTLRLRLGYLTPKFRGVWGYAEMEGNYELGIARYDSLRHRRSHAVVADPQETELNQAWIAFGTKGFTIKVGRQRIIHDDHRFIGNVVWRQLEQTYDAVRLKLEPLSHFEVDCAWIWRVQNVLSRTVDMASPLLHLQYRGLPFGKVTAYAYWLDYDSASDSQGYRLSSQTYGLRLEGSAPLTGRLKGHYHLEYARQMDYRRNPEDFSADYYRLVAGLSAFGVTVKGGVEELAADHGVGFSTPLATLHAFQGWADQFLRTPRDGVRDLYAEVNVNLWRAKLVGVYHDFQDENGDRRYGEEYDALLRRDFGNHLTVLLKYAYYNAKGFSRDTQKVWGQVAVHF